LDLATLVGLAAGLLLMAFAMMRGGSVTDFVDPVALAVTLGGTLAAALVQFPLARLKAALGALRFVARPRPQDLPGLVRTLVEYAERARREGLLALEADADTASDPFLRKGLQLVVDGTDPDELRAILENDLAGVQARHKQNAALYETLAQYGPAFGLAGTLIAMVTMLQGLQDPSGLGADMARALLATFYGVLLANLLFTPVAGKLKARSIEEVLQKELLVEGIAALQNGDTPVLLLEKLNSFLPPGQQVRRSSVRDLSPEEE
jgi:chemotaxis protein MotA